MKKLFFLLILALPFLAVKCPQPDNPPIQTVTKPKPDTLPPATQVGANTFGCIVNGKVWLPEGNPGKPSLNVQYYKGWLTLSAFHQIRNIGDTVNQLLIFGYKPIYTTGKFYFKSYPGPYVEYDDIVNKCVYTSSDSDSLSTVINITKLDSTKNIVSGTFNLIFYPQSKGCDTIRITNGRFDAIYEY